MTANIFWKTRKKIFAILVGLFLIPLVIPLSPFSVKAQEAPTLTLVYLATNNNDPNDGWVKNVQGDGGDALQFYVEVHNASVNTIAHNLKVKVNLPTANFTQGESTVNVSSLNSQDISEKVNVEVKNAGGGRLEFVPGSTKLTWDQDGDGTKEFNEQVMQDGIANGGLNLGDLRGCNEFIIQISFRAKIVGEEGTPTPTPTPTFTPTPSPVGQTQSQTQTQTQSIGDITQSVTVTQPQVAGTQAAQAKELPKTGGSVLLLSSLLGGLPGGAFLKGLAGRFSERARGIDGSPQEARLWNIIFQEKKRKKDGVFDEES